MRDRGNCTANWVDSKSTIAPEGRIPLDISTIFGTLESIMKNRHIGSDFDDFLQKEGLLAETEAAAIKRVIAYQIKKAMTERNLTKSSMARIMGTSRSSLNRLLDPENASVTLLTLESAAVALGRKLKIEIT